MATSTYVYANMRCLKDSFCFRPQQNFIVRLFYLIYNFIVSLFAYIYLTPLEESSQWVHSLSTYGNTPNFFLGSIQDASRQSKEQFKFLIIYIQSPLHHRNEMFGRNVIAHPEFVEFVDEHFVCWGGSISNFHTQKVSYSLGISQYPFLGMYYYSQSTHMPLGLHLLCQFDSQQGHDAMIDSMRTALQRHETIIADARREQEERERTRELMEEQARAFMESMERDRERERQRAEEERKRLEKEREEELKLKEIEDMAQQLPEEPSPDEPGITRIVVRLMDGLARAERRFKETDSTDMLYRFVISKEKTDNLEILGGFPSQKIERSKTLTLKEVDLVPKAMVISQEPF